MVRISVLYPHESGKKFDHDYYAKKHMPLVHKRLSPLGGRIVLCSLQPWIRQSFESVGFHRLFSICGTREEAVLACARPSA